MYKKIFIAVFLIASITSCKSKKAPEQNISKSDSFQFAPIIELLKADADDVMKTPYYLYIIKEKVGSKKKDSSTLSRDLFTSIIRPLTSIKITSDNYKEISFEDLSTKSISFITSALDTSNKIKSIATLLNSETKKLKSIFVVMNYNQNDTNFRKQYFWQAEKSLTITTSKTLPSKKEIIEKEFINWNNKIEL